MSESVPLDKVAAIDHIIRDRKQLENIYGEEFIQLNPTKSINLGIETIHQENFLAEDLTVAENIFVGYLCEAIGKKNYVSLRLL